MVVFYHSEKLGRLNFYIETIQKKGKEVFAEITMKKSLESIIVLKFKSVAKPIVNDFIVQQQSLENFSNFQISYINEQAKDLFGAETPVEILQHIHDIKIQYNQKSSVINSQDSEQQKNKFIEKFNKKNLDQYILLKLKNYERSQFHKKYMNNENIEDLKEDIFANTQFNGGIYLDITLHYLRKEQNIFIMISMRKINQVMLKRRESELKKYQDHILSSFSHNLKTPLNGILMTCDLVQSNEQNFDKINLIRKNARYLMIFVNDILDYSRLITGRFVLSKSVFDLQSLVNNLIDILVEQFKRSDVTFDVDYSFIDQDFTIYTDKERLFQVLFNLLSNAFQFTFKGRVILKIIKTERYFKFEVIDTGCGINEEQKFKLEQFSFGGLMEINPNTERIDHTSGSGLGIIICQSILHMIGSTQLQIESQIDLGSTFSFQIEYTVLSDSKIIPKEKLSNLQQMVQSRKTSELFPSDIQSFNQSIFKRLSIENQLQLSSISLKSNQIHSLKNIRSEYNEISDLKDFQKQLQGFDQRFLCEDQQDIVKADEGSLDLNSNRRVFSKYQTKCIFSKYCNENKSEQNQASEDGEIEEKNEIEEIKPRQIMRASIFFAGKAAKPTFEDQIVEEEQQKREFQKIDNDNPYQLLENFFKINDKILIVDDTFFNILCLKTLISQFTISQIDEVYNGKQAIELIQTINSDMNHTNDTPYNIIFMDIGMPIMDGYQATKIIKSVYKNEIQVVLVSAFTSQYDKQAGYDNGADYFIDKPATIDQLLEMSQFFEESK